MNGKDGDSNLYVCFFSPEESISLGEAGTVDSSTLWLIKLNSLVVEFTNLCLHLWKYLYPICIECLPCVRHHAKCFTCSNSFHFHNNSILLVRKLRLNDLFQIPQYVSDGAKFWSQKVVSRVHSKPSQDAILFLGVIQLLFVIMVLKCVFIS